MQIDKRSEANIKQRIATILHELACDVHEEDLNEAIAIAYKKPEAVCSNFMNVICAPIANREGIHIVSANRRLEKAVRAIWVVSSQKSREKYLGETLAQNRKTPFASEFISTIAEYLRMQEASDTFQSKISKLLIDIGILPNFKAFQTFKDAIRIAYEEPEKKHSIRAILAQKYGITTEAIERHMITALNSAWKKGNSEAVKKYFGNALIKKTTICQFIVSTTEYFKNVDKCESSTSKRISNILNDIGVPAKNLGYYYLQMAIETLYNGETTVTDIIHTMGKKTGMKQTNISSSIYRIVFETWKNITPYAINKYFAKAEITSEKRPLTREFIASIVNYMIEEDQANN